MSIEAEILAQMAVSTEVQHGLDELSGEVRDYAKSIAPVFGDRPPHRDAPPKGSEGDFRDSIQVEKVAGELDVRRVISRDDPMAVWQELGTRHMPEYAVFAKAAAMFGGSGPVVDEGVQHAQHKLRHELEKLAKLRAGVAGTMAEAVERATSISAQKHAVDRARLARSAAFKAARGARGGGRRGR
jgi:hypothetical protein